MSSCAERRLHHEQQRDGHGGKGASDSIDVLSLMQ